LSARSWQIVFVTSSGKNPLRDWLQEEVNSKDRARVLRQLEMLGEFGTSLNYPHVRRLRDKIWELRPGRIRILYFVPEQYKIVLLHGFFKKTQKTPAREIEIAEKRLREYLEQEKHRTNDN
jgi:phage-related protein